MQLAKSLAFKAVTVLVCDDGLSHLRSRVETAADEAELDDVIETEHQLCYAACICAFDRLIVNSVKPARDFIGDLSD